MVKKETLLNNLDIKILAELDNNSKIPVTQLAKKIRSSREVTKYRLKKLVDSGVIKNFTTMINPAKFGFIIYKIYLKFQNLSIEKEKELLRYLNKNKKVFWLAKTDGAYDLIAGIYVENTMEFNEFLLNFIGKFSQNISSRHISNTVYVNPFRKKYLLQKSISTENVIWGGIPEKIKIDELMRNLLKSIAENSRISIADICEKLKTTPKTIISKIKYLEKEKIILGYKITLNLSKINKENFKAIIYFQDITSKKESSFKEFCKTNPFITYYIKTVGEWDLELDIEISSYNEFNKLIKEIKTQFREIIRNIEGIHISEEIKGELNIVQNI